jgi:hypothetical protein
MVIAYINSPELIAEIESIMEYYKFTIIESNNNFRVFLGHFSGSAGKLTARLNSELEHARFDIEDSLFIAYPVLSNEGTPSMGSMIIKRKGNKYLRKKFIS